MSVRLFACTAALAACVAVGQPARAAELSGPARDALRLVQSADPYERELGFLRLEALRDPETLPSIRPYTESKDPDTRSQSYRAVSAIEGASAVPLLMQRYRKEKVARVRRALLLALEPHANADPQLVALLIDALKDRKTDVRMAAADIVSRLDDPRAHEALRAREKRERRKDVRRVLQAALQRIPQ